MGGHMTRQRMLAFLVVLLLLISVGTVVAQSSADFVVHRTTLLSGGISNSADFTVHSVIGQPSVGVVETAGIQGTVGYLFPLPQGGRLYLPLMAR